MPSKRKAPELKYFHANLLAVCKGRRGIIQQIADDTGFTRAHVSRIIAGKASPTLESAAKISKAVGYDLGDLLEKPKDFRKVAC